MQHVPAQFENQAIRRAYDEATETWWFSVVDIVQVLTQQPDDLTARKYWNQLKRRLGKEGSELVTSCHQLKMTAADGKQRLTDAATAQTLLRLVQSVPSPKAEPIKLWLAKVGYERMQELADPALSLERARETWQQHGRSKKWVQQRMMGQETRAKLTDYWATHDIKEGQEFAILTNLIHQEWAEVSIKAHKDMKGLKTQNIPNGFLMPSPPRLGSGGTYRNWCTRPRHPHCGSLRTQGIAPQENEPLRSGSGECEA
ncbi:MAG: BRO family protein [Geothrix sp.]|nr:BRO family protein [Geothrix sp.]